VDQVSKLVLNNGTYQIDGIDAVGLAEKYGTPLYIYSADKIAAQYKRLTEAFSSTNMKVRYACKALTNLNILKILKNCGSGLDTVSIQEVKIGLKAGFDPKEIIFTPNGISIAEINDAATLGVVINIDNISILEQFGNQHGGNIPICIRINPHILAGGNYQISTGHIDSKFGISIHQLRHVERVVETTGLNVTGLHMHTGSEILDIDVFLRGVNILFEVAEKFPNLEFLDLGSGFKVPMSPGADATDLEGLGKQLSEKFNNFCKEYGKELELWFEPGKYLVSEAGTFLAKVNVVKHTTATVFAGVDSGFNHLIRPMFYNAYQHIVNASNPNGVERIYTVSGYICETDNFAWDRKISEIKEGDILAIQNAGAYGFEMSSNYNSRLRPPEVLIMNGEDHLIRKREELEDNLRNQVLLDLK
jgi:diaminopimelate decarboxylase